MYVFDRVERWLGAAAVTLSPLLVLVLPSLVVPGADYTSAEEQTRAFANGRFPYEGLVLQITGAVLLVPAVQRIAGAVFRRRRGMILASIGLVTGMVAAFGLLLVLGMELSMAFILSHGGDKEAVVALALAVSRSSIYGALLAIGFAGFLLALPILALALWRSRMVPIVVPVLFLLPVLAPFVPLPTRAADLVPAFSLLLPCLWITVQLLRQPPLTPTVSDGMVESAARSDADLSTSDAAH